MNYTTRSGVILEEICGEYALIAVRGAWEHCKAISRINAQAAYLWQLFEKGLTLDQVVAETAAHYNISEEAVRQGLTPFLESMTEAGYLIPEEDNQDR